MHAGEAMRWRLVLDEQQAVTRMRTVSGETLTQKFNTNTHTAADVHRWLATREDPTTRVDIPTLLYDLPPKRLNTADTGAQGRRSYSRCTLAADHTGGRPVSGRGGACV